MSVEDIERFLRNNRVIEALPTPDLVPESRRAGVLAVQAADRLPSVFAKLIEHKVQSVPVIEDDKPIGIVDVLDILCFAHDSVKEIHDAGTDSEFIRQEVFQMVSAKDVMNFSNRDPFETITSESSLWTAVTLILEKGARRLVVVNPNGRVTSVLSQVDILRYLTPIIANFSKGSNTVSELKLGTQNVKTISIDALARDAFTLIRKEGVSAIGIVDNEGRLLANLSATDLKLIGQDSAYFRLLNLPLNKLRDYASLPAPVTVRPQNSLAQVINSFNRIPLIHRVYVVDDEGKPIAIITPSDILAALVLN